MIETYEEKKKQKINSSGLKPVVFNDPSKFGVFMISLTLFGCGIGLIMSINSVLTGFISFVTILLGLGGTLWSYASTMEED